MAKPLSLEIEGLDKLKNALNKSVNQGLVKKIDKIIEVNIEKQRRDAIRLAPANFGGGGGLRSEITTNKVADMNYELISGKKYSAFIEFGTGALVDVPPGLEDYAIQFKGKGVRKVNLPARPFFFPSFPATKIQIIQDIKDILKDL